MLKSIKNIIQDMKEHKSELEIFRNEVTEPPKEIEIQNFKNHFKNKD